MKHKHSCMQQKSSVRTDSTRTPLSSTPTRPVLALPGATTPSLPFRDWPAADVNPNTKTTDPTTGACVHSRTVHDSDGAEEVVARRGSGYISNRVDTLYPGASTIRRKNVFTLTLTLIVSTHSTLELVLTERCLHPNPCNNPNPNRVDTLYPGASTRRRMSSP